MSIATDITVSKPSKALNIIYFIFGYVLASALIPLQFDVMEQIIVIIAIGSIFATFLYYIKPVERVLLVVVFLLQKNQQKKGFSLFGDIARLPGTRGTPYLLSSPEVFNSPMIAYEKAKIKGAVFFSIVVLVSGSTLDLIGIPQPLMFLVIFSLPTLIVAIWEVGALWMSINVLVYFYDFLRSGVSIQVVSDLRKAIDRKDWLEAKIMITNYFFIRSCLW